MIELLINTQLFNIDFLDSAPNSSDDLRLYSLITQLFVAFCFLSILLYDR